MSFAEGEKLQHHENHRMFICNTFTCVLSREERIISSAFASKLLLLYLTRISLHAEPNLSGLFLSSLL